MSLTPLTAKKEGLALVNPLTAAVEGLRVHTDDDYREADELLGRIRAGRRKWTLRLSEVLDPAKAAVVAAKKALASVQTLHEEFDEPLATLESAVKDKMRLFKLEEARQAQAAEVERTRAKHAAEAAIAAKAFAEAKAKTAPMRQRLAEQREALEQQAAEQEAAPAPAAVKGAMSAARHVQKVRVLHWGLLGTSVTEGPVPETVLSANLQLLLAFFKAHPDYSPADFGCELYDDVVIAGR